jgi:hypothetical protein
VRSSVWSVWDAVENVTKGPLLITKVGRYFPKYVPRFELRHPVHLNTESTSKRVLSAPNCPPADRVLRHKRVSDICDGNAIQGRQHGGQHAYRAE